MNTLKFLAENPIYAILISVGIVGMIFSIKPMLNAKKIGIVECKKCGHTGKLKQTMMNQLVCDKCGSSDWKPIDK